MMNIFALLLQVGTPQPAAAAPQPGFWTIRVTDIIMILAVSVAPWIAVWIQERLQLGKEKRERKLWIFKTLMATRATTINIHHVQALNLIDVEFNGRGPEEAIRTAWKVYLDHLNEPLNWEKAEQAQKDAWNEGQKNLLAELLQKMGATLGYNYDVVYLKRHVYLPRGHGEAEVEELLTRKGWLNVVMGKSSLKMDITGVPVTEEEAGEQATLRKAAIRFMEGKEKLPVKIVPEGDGGA